MGILCGICQDIYSGSEYIWRYILFGISWHIPQRILLMTYYAQICHLQILEKICHGQILSEICQTGSLANFLREFAMAYFFSEFALANFSTQFDLVDLSIILPCRKFFYGIYLFMANYQLKIKFPKQFYLGKFRKRIYQ